MIMRYPFRILGWLTALMLLFTIGFGDITGPAPAEAAGSKRYIQNKSTKWVRAECKKTNIHYQTGRPVKHTVWQSHCLDYQKARKIRVWRGDGIPYSDDVTEWHATPKMSWTIQANPSRGRPPVDRRLPCFRSSHSHPGAAFGVHYRVTWLVGGGRTALAEVDVTDCNYFNVGLQASIR